MPRPGSTDAREIAEAEPGAGDAKTGGVLVHWTKDWSDVPVLAPASCRHPGSDTLAVGLHRPEGARGFVPTATLCMLCGVDRGGRLAPADALEAAWREHGWHRATGQRLLELAGIDPQMTPPEDAS